MSEKPEGGIHLVVDNRVVRHEYHVVEAVECGLKLSGAEVKSVRAGNISIKEAFGRIVDGEAWLYQMTIGPYPNARWNPDPGRPRKLLLHQREIKRIHAEIRVKGKTWVPTKLYFKGGWLKIEMAVAIGKKLYDKRQSMKEADAKREIGRAMSRKR